MTDTKCPLCGECVHNMEDYFLCECGWTENAISFLASMVRELEAQNKELSVQAQKNLERTIPFGGDYAKWPACLTRSRIDFFMVAISAAFWPLFLIVAIVIVAIPKMKKCERIGSKYNERDS